MSSWKEKERTGSIAEAEAIKLLSQLGFKIMDVDGGRLYAYDLLVEKGGVRYAINVKTSNNKQMMFGINGKNLSRLHLVKDAIPVLLFLNDDITMFFTLDDSIIPTRGLEGVLPPTPSAGRWRKVHNHLTDEEHAPGELKCVGCGATFETVECLQSHQDAHLQAFQKLDV